MRALAIFALAAVLFIAAKARGQTQTNPITRETVTAAEKLFGLDFSDAKIDLMLPGLQEQLGKFEALRKFPLSNSVPPALCFNPIPVGTKIARGRSKFRLSPPGKAKPPPNLSRLHPVCSQNPSVRYTTHHALSI